jgi:hypothetical protein
MRKKERKKQRKKKKEKYEKANRNKTNFLTLRVSKTFVNA